MSDLSGSIEGQLHTSIAAYFNVTTAEVQLAIKAGALTYQHVYNFIKTGKI